MVLLLAVLSVLWVAVGPAPRPVDAPVAEFSAGRAMAELAEIAPRRHPAGSVANERVRDRLMARLTELGLRPTVQRTSAAVPGTGSSHAFGWAENVSATLPGPAGAGRLLLVAHYDSVEIGPGASDDGVGVAALLEIARVLAGGPALAAEITLLFTDNEEFVQVGARGFVAAGLAGDPGRSVVLNLDTRGTSGRTIMFETGAHSAALIPALYSRPPVVTSLSREVYRLLPNETDFTPFLAAGHTGLNFAMVDGSARYHSEQDDLSHVDGSSVQDMGETVLAATRALAAADLSAVAQAGESVQFGVFGLLVDYPAGVVLSLAVIALLGAGAAVWFARRRGGIRLPVVLRCAAAMPLVPVGAAAIGWLGWQALLLADPGNGRFLGGDPYDVVLSRIGFVVLASAVVALWLAWTSRWSRPGETAAAGVLVSAVLAAVTAVLVPGVAYLFTWPALAAAVGLAVTTVLGPDSRWRAAVAWLAAAPAAVLIAPLVWLLLGTVGLALAAAPLLLFGLAAVTAVPSWEQPPRRRVVAVVAVLAGIGLVALDPVVGAGGPAQVSLQYAVDTDRGAAYWVSEGPDIDDWVRSCAGTDDPVLEQRFPVLSVDGGLRSGPAPVLPVPSASLEVREQVPDGELRRIRLKLTGTGRPTQVAVYVHNGGVALASAEIGGKSFPGNENRPFTDTGWRWGLVLSALPPEGAELTLTVRGSAPARVAVVAQSPELPVAGLERPRPEGVGWGGNGSGLAFSARGYEF